MEIKTDFENYYILPTEGTSYLKSRDDPSMASHFYGLYPIMSSPMKWLGNPKFVIEMAANHCFGFLHRFDTEENRKEAIRQVANRTNRFGVAIGVDNFRDEWGIAAFALDQGAKVILIDVANGYLDKVHEKIVHLIDIGCQNIMVGNVITKAGVDDLNKAGANFIRVGIGNGGNCMTRTVTGIGRNQLAAIKDCRNDLSFVVADGGMKNSGDAAKAFVAGADFIMTASLLSHAEEAEHDGVLYGMASERMHKMSGKNIKTIEGFETVLQKERKPLEDILQDILYGVKSSCTYLNCQSYTEMRTKGRLVPVVEDL